MRYTVYDDKSKVLGHADSFGECKKIHEKWLEETNHPEKDNYAGLDCSAGLLQADIACPAFYVEG